MNKLKKKNTNTNLLHDEILLDLVMETRGVNKPRAKSIVRNVLKEEDSIQERRRQLSREEETRIIDELFAEPDEVEDMSLSEFLKD